MAKLDPIVSEFATTEEAEAYDKWFRAQVEEGLRSKGPFIPHDEVMRSAREFIKNAKHAKSSLGS
ncbi:MAG: stability determinant [Novosphingobium sp.]|nr:stability determinant [Novosphingobium sp.]